MKKNKNKYFFIYNPLQVFLSWIEIFKNKSSNLFDR